jgi:uncharacterized protein YjiS (DUF1127 family)
MSASRQFTPIANQRDRAGRRFGHLLACGRGVLAWARRCAERSAQRRALARLSDWELRDIGISRREAAAEAGKWWWRP